MTEEAPWMESIDREILETMTDDDVYSPDQVTEAVDCRPPQAAYRCRELAKRGLLVKHMTGVYDITADGNAVLAGELDPATLED